MKHLVLAAPVLVLAACANTPSERPFQRTAENEQRLSQWLEGRTPRGSTGCVPQFSAREQRIIDARTILFRGAGGGTVYRSEIRACPQLDRNSTIIRRSISPQLCEGEIFEVRDAGSPFPEGSCTFGPITRYD